MEGFANAKPSALSSCGNMIIDFAFEAWTTTYSLYNFLKQEVKIVWGQRESKRLFLYVLALYGFMALEVTYGYFTTSLVLIALVFYTNTTAVSLCVSLVSFLCTKHQKTAAYTYGYQRLEIVAAFTDGVFHTIAAGFIIIEALEHLIVEVEEPSYSGFKMVSLVLLGVALNFGGSLLFHSHKVMHATGEQKVKGARESSALFWNVVTNVVSGLGAILACYLVQWGVILADCVMAIVVSAMLMACSWPLARNMGRVLLQSTPFSIDGRLKRSISEASAVDGVLVCKDSDARFWTLSPNEYVGSLHIRVKADADEQAVLAKVHNIFSGWITNLTIQIEKEHI